MYTIFYYKLTSSRKTIEVILKTTELHSKLAHFRDELEEIMLNTQTCHIDSNQILGSHQLQYLKTKLPLQI